MQLSHAEMIKMRDGERGGEMNMLSLPKAIHFVNETYEKAYAEAIEGYKKAHDEWWEKNKESLAILHGGHVPERKIDPEPQCPRYDPPRNLIGRRYGLFGRWFL